MNSKMLAVCLVWLVCHSMLVVTLAEWSLPKLVVFSFDGFRHDFLNATLTPNLYALANAGVRGHMRSTFVTKTYPNHQSIVTGLYEPFHGIVNNEFIDPQLESRFNVDNPSSEWWDQRNLSVPIYIANQVFEAGRASGSSQWPGSIAFYTDGKGGKRTRVHYLEEYNPDLDWRKRADTILGWLSDPTHPANLVVAYFVEPDSTAHSYGPFSAQVADKVRALDRMVGYFRKRLTEQGLAQQTNLIFLSDHGLAEVTADRLFDLRKCDPDYPGLQYELYGVSPVFSAIPLSAPHNASANLTLAEGVRDALNQCAANRYHGKFRVFLQEDIPVEFHYGNNSRILPLFILADDGYDLLDYDKGWRPKGWPVWGNHGYNQSLPSMRPLFLALGRSFKTAYVHPIQFDNVDLYPLMLRLLHIPVDRFPSNGSLANVEGMLTHQLYLSDDDFLMAQSEHIAVVSYERGQKWMHFLLYLGIGFCALFFSGACFALSASFHKGTVSKKPSPGNFLRRLLQRQNDGRDYRHYRMFADSRPLHADSSFEDEDELYCKGPNRTGMRLTEIDWNIVGTGLDIDLPSQLDDSAIYSQSSRATYLEEQESSTIILSQSVEQKSLLQSSSSSPPPLHASIEMEEDLHCDSRKLIDI